MKLVLLAFTILGFWLSGCGGYNSLNNTGGHLNQSSTALGIAQKILGSWQGMCHFESALQRYVSFKITVDSDQFLFTIQAYSTTDISCSAVSYEQRISYSYQLGGNQQLQADLDLQLQKIEMVAFDAATAQEFNAFFRCGHNKWAVAQVQDVTQSSCNTVADAHYNIVGTSSDGHQLYLGGVKIYGWNDPEQRPKKLDLQEPFISEDLSESSLQVVKWIDRVGVAVTGTSVVKTTATAWGNSGMASLQYIPGDGGVSFTAQETNTYRMCGLSASNANANYTTIGFTIYLSIDGALHIYEKGVHLGMVGTYVAGDHLRVERKGSVVLYKKNSQIIYKSSVQSQGSLIVDCALYSKGATIIDALVWGGR